MTPPIPHVTDHAVLRYLERAHGVPVEAIRTALAASAAIGVVHGAPAVVFDKIKLVIVDGRVVTVVRSSWNKRVDVARSRRRPAREG